MHCYYCSRNYLTLGSLQLEPRRGKFLPVQLHRSNQKKKIINQPTKSLQDVRFDLRFMGGEIALLPTSRRKPKYFDGFTGVVYLLQNSFEWHEWCYQNVQPLAFFIISTCSLLLCWVYNKFQKDASSETFEIFGGGCDL